MKTDEFLNLLESHQEQSLLFEYAPSLFVGANYHITEVKHVTVDAVDCGAGAASWKETIIQLYENPEELGKTTYMSAAKALSILTRVGKLKPYTPDALLKIEYSNAAFHTAQLFVTDVVINERGLHLKLNVAPTDCKAKAACGITENVEPEVGCAPGTGCC